MDSLKKVNTKEYLGNYKDPESLSKSNQNNTTNLKAMSETVRKAILTTKPHYTLLHSQGFTIKNKLSSDIASKTLTIAIGRQLFLFQVLPYTFHTFLL